MYYKTCFRIKLPDYVKNKKTFNKYISELFAKYWRIKNEKKD